MIGLSDKGWLIEMMHEGKISPLDQAVRNDRTPFYDAYFGLGQTVRLIDKPGVFKVSPAGLALGALLLKALDERELSGKILDVGTGSGVQAILLRVLGATNITASDVCRDAVVAAVENELLNFDNNEIRFVVADLFNGTGDTGEQFDVIVFNPPGWRTPSASFLDELRRIGGNDDMKPASMFYGDQTLLRFLRELPDHLCQRGRAIVGVNSLVGIQDVLGRYRICCSGAPPLNFRLMERHTFPLIFYSEAWKRARSALFEEFEAWRTSNGAAYTRDSQGRIYWSYELIECRLNENGRR